MKTAYLGLGSNLGDREKNLEAALAGLAAPNLRVTRVSSVYESEPVGFTAQRWFLNLVAEVETELFPMQLLSHIGKLERALGRVRTVKNGPRTLDIDILLYGKAVVRSAQLEIPHPRMGERRFVLAPLAELAPELRHPVTHRSIRAMLDAAPPLALRKLDLKRA
ncbi:MAG TPA: 2-amino-4-hydroxy-6-hydroxymethyldihydropteridine diphosphokinase [Bryobacteraceae bacterium]|nr:2-amino-4-hydroxy-6-hydroxymethyldihydropteridine diphosphokinase [Bryobacteraceae bacterium]